MSWSRKFDDPIPLPDGRTIRTLREAALYIKTLPPKESRKPHWQTAVRELLISADRGGIILLARIAMMRALNFGRPIEKRTRTAKVYKIVR